MNLNNKKILITGATSGIGRALALQLSKQNTNLILLSRNEKKLGQVYDEIKKNNDKNKIAICPFDLTIASQKDYENLLTSLTEEYSQLDILFNNAAILEKLCPLELLEPYLWLKTMQVNLNASFLLTHYLLPLLKKSKKAQIWFMSSSVASNPRANWGAYSVSKAAQNCLMKTLASEKKNMIINSINPGATRTKMRAIAYPFENKDTLISAENVSEKIIHLIKTIDKSGEIINLN